MGKAAGENEIPVWCENVRRVSPSPMLTGVIIKTNPSILSS